MESPTSVSAAGAAAAAAAASTSAADPPSPTQSSQSLSRSSSPDPTNPSPSPTSTPPPSGSAPPAAPPPSSSSSHRRVPPPCWSTEETIALIDAYQDKWYSLRRGNLRANDWQDVADAVTARGPRRLVTAAVATTHSSSAGAAKTAVQCRHKVEKLRKRYRAEKQRALKRNPRAPPKSSWEFFRKMHAMESGGPPPQPGANKGGGGAGAAGTGPQARRPGGAFPSQSPHPSISANSDNDDDEEDDNNHHHHQQRFRHTCPLNGLMMTTMPNGPGRHGAPAAGASGFRFKVPKAVRTKLLSPRGEPVMVGRHQGSSNNNSPFGGLPRHHNHQQQPQMATHGYAEMRDRVLNRKNRKRHLAQQREDDEDSRVGGGGGMGEVAEAVRMLGDGFMRMEQMKMDMAMQIHRLRMETEMKRTQMMIDSNKKILDLMIGGGTTGTTGNKRTKASS